MDKRDALTCFTALGQPTRLDVFRLLVGAGDVGMAVNELCETLSVRQNTMSANLSVLLNARLVRNEREGRSVRYFADLDGVRSLLAFLMEDCCGGRPEVCQSVLDELVCS